MSSCVEAILIGAGNRGAQVYAQYALRHPDQLRFIAVAEPDPVRRARFAIEHNINAENCYESWQPLLERSQFAEAALVCTQDNEHTRPTLAALNCGYHVLLEKPMATRAEECRQLVEASEAANRQLHICHVLRYTPHFRKLREIIRSGVIGQIIHVDHSENIAWWHMAHSYVRGNWRNSSESSPMILAKCCHDFDILLWMLDRRCLDLSSAGSLAHFRPEHAPAQAAARCLDCQAAPNCPFDAAYIYLSMIPFWENYAVMARGFNRLAVRTWLISPRLIQAAAKVYPRLRKLNDYRGWPLDVLCPDPSPENIRAALESGPYGRCVYACDNDVVDHQVVNMCFEDEITVTLTMQGFSHYEHRATRIEGSHALLTAEFGTGGSRIIVDEHRSERRTVFDTSPQNSTGHGGGDEGLVSAFISSLRGKNEQAVTTARQSLESHLMAFAAERARLEKRTINGEEFLR
ncbi:MAG TPA: Gfo/Idh/MocA family oxidoreductase [Levilinea sp.]|nr:Gfo/Idh/MocA family oxidoreductase [Levilinea sp.]